MKYLIIPDVHNRVAWAEQLVANFPDRRVVFLGDYFDSFGDSPAVARYTAEWLRYSLDQGRVHLMGNHDLPYFWPGWRPIACPGWTKEKQKVVSYTLSSRDRDRILLTFTVAPPGGRPILLTHAGVTLANLYGVDYRKDVARAGRLAHLRDMSVGDHLEQVVQMGRGCRAALNGRIWHAWLEQGSRMGEITEGGPFWIDIHDHTQIAGIDQIVGHSHVATPQRHCMPHKFDPEAVTWFIDGGGKFAALIDGGVVTPIHARGDRLGQPAYP